MPRPRKDAQNEALLQAALEGLEVQRDRIDLQISQVRSMLGVAVARRGRPPGKKAIHSSSTLNGAASPHGGKRKLSAAARQRIADAQRRRWAEYRKNSSAASAS